MAPDVARSLVGKAGVAVIITYVWDESIMDYAHLQLPNWITDFESVALDS